MKLSLFIIMAISSFAQINAQKIELTGKVVDARTQEELAGATIVFKNHAYSGTNTNLDGNFILRDSLGIQDTLMVYYVGYLNEYMLLYLSKDTSIIVQLKDDKSFELTEVEITAKDPIAEDFVIQKLTGLQVLLNPSSSGDPLLAVRSLPSSTTTNESANISLRGSDPANTGIFLNGVPIYNATKFAQLGGIGTFSIFNPMIIKKILVFPSNPPLEFGNSGSGMISLETDDSKKDQFANISLGLAQSGFMLGTPLGKKSQSMLKMYSNIQSQLVFKPINKSSFKDLNSFGMEDAGVHFSTKLNNKASLRIFAYGINEYYNYTFRHPSLESQYLYHKIRGFYVANFEKMWNKSSLTINQSISQGKSVSGVGVYQPGQINKEFYFSINYKRFWSNKISTRSGLTWDYQGIASSGTYPVKSYDYNYTAPFVNYLSNVDRNIKEVYTYLKYNPSEKFVIGLGVRKNLPFKIKQDYLSYQGNIRFNLNKSAYLNLSSGKYHSYFVPDTSISGYNFVTTNQLSLDFVYEKEKIYFSSAAYIKTENSIIKNRIRGFEMYIKYAPKMFSVDFSFASAHALSSYNALVYPSMNNVRFLFKSNIQFVLPFVLVGISNIYRAGAPFTPINNSIYDSSSKVYDPIYGVINGANIPNYFRTDIILSRYLGFKNNSNSLIVYLSVNNVFNINNAREANYNYNYSQRYFEYFQKRFIYFGLVFNLNK